MSMEFFSKISPNARLLVVDLGFLGDTIHLIPSLAAIRRALPQARVEVIVAEHVKGILTVCPWLNEVHGYPRFPRSQPWYKNLRRALDLREKKFDAVINLNGSDRSSILTRMTGAPLRLGRVPPKNSWFWPYCYTHTVNVPFGAQPLFRQRLDALAAAGFPNPSSGDPFPIEIAEAVRKKVSSHLGAERAFIHVSPFATANEKELPEGMLAEMLNRVAAAQPDLPMVLSSAPNDRERNKLSVLMGQLKFVPWKVFPGNLSLLELAELMRRARLHLGGDSGALHIALMAGTPTFSWWRDYAGRVEWMPQGPKHAALVGTSTPEGIKGLEVEALVAGVTAHLEKNATKSPEQAS